MAKKHKWKYANCLCKQRKLQGKAAKRKCPENSWVASTSTSVMHEWVAKEVFDPPIRRLQGYFPTQSNMSKLTAG